MIKDNEGQVSFEYLLIFAISLIILIVFTMPLLNQTIETTFDVSDSIKVKDDLSKIALSVNSVYGEGQGSKQTVNINSVKPLKVNVASNYLSCNLKLKDNKNKLIKVPCKSNLKSSSINVEKGGCSIVVEWPVGSERMVIY
ncbi:class III signal peptide-containing protein [Methanobrevibacter sp.]|uniref:class III signal peptide-containing protein n=1 Tax=Methanobrevibacter sp. TaxID=66852 RepID=UPI0038902588